VLAHDQIAPIRIHTGLRVDTLRIPRVLTLAHHPAIVRTLTP
jgi:hypothetical protein